MKTKCCRCKVNIIVDEEIDTQLEHICDDCYEEEQYQHEEDYPTFSDADPGL